MSDAISPRFRSVGRLRVRYAESEPVDGSTILLLNPWPESLYAWEALWPRLSAQARLVAVDLPGFGRSESREDLYSPRAMGAFLIQLIEAWDLGRPHVFGPDVGTGATLFAAAQAPDALSSAVVGSGASAHPLEVTGTLKDLIEAPDLEELRALDGRDVVANALTQLESYEPSETARRDYLDSYAGSRFAESAQYVRSYPTDLAGLAALAPGADAGTAVDFAVLGYAITSMETETYRPSRVILLGEDATPRQRRETSLDALVTPSAPPFFIWHTAEDVYVPPEHTYRLARALADNGVAHTVHVFAHGPHSLGLARGAGDAAMWTTLAARWIAEA